MKPIGLTQGALADAAVARTLCAKNKSFRANSTRFVLPDLSQKNFAWRIPQINGSLFPFRSPEGRIAIVTNAERDCGGREVLCAMLCADEQCFSRTAKPCGPGAPMQALSSWDMSYMTRLADDGGKKARSPGRARSKPLKPSRRECRTIAVCPWLLTPVLSCCTGGHGCNAHPAFPAPSAFRWAFFFAQLGRAAPRESGITSGCRHCEEQRDEAIQCGERSPGLLRFARNDG
jgi:hypothetical protein